MTYAEFKHSIGSKLRKNSAGLTWNQLKTALDLPYERPCPEWVKQLEKEIGLVRGKDVEHRARVWRLEKKVG
jgi:hypothetical protein